MRLPWRRRAAATPDSAAVHWADLDALLPILKAAQGISAGEADLAKLIAGRTPQVNADIDQTNYLQAYQTALWVHVCTYQTARACAAVPLKLRNTKTGADVEQHDILNLLAYVNGPENWPWFCGALVSYHLLAGEAFILLGPEPAQPYSMYLLRPDRMEPRVSGGELSGWWYQVGNDRKPLKAEEVIQFKRFNPLNAHRGQPVLQAGEVSINLDIAVRKFNNAYLRAGAIPPFLLSTEQDVGEAEAKRILETWKNKHSGPDKAGEPAIVPRGLKPTVIQGQKSEGSFIDLARLSKGEVLALFGVPPIIAQDYADASVLANAEVQRQEFYRRTILNGEMTALLGVLNEQLVPRWDRALELYADEAAMPELQEDEATRWARVSQATGSPFLTINEAREQLGLEPVDGGDVILVDPMKYPLGASPPVPEPKPETAAPTPPPSPEEEAPPPKAVVIGGRRAKQVTAQQREWGDERHQELSKAFVNRIHPHIARVRRAMAGVYDDLIDEVLAHLRAEEGKGYRLSLPDFRKAEILTEYLFDLEEAGAVTVARLMPLVRDVFEDGGERGLAQLAGGAFSMDNPRAARWMANHALKIVTLPEALYDDIRQRLVTGAAEGQTIRDLAGEIEALKPGYETWQAERVATTEAVGAENAGSLECYKQNGAARKEWSSQIDEVTRPDHADADGQIVDVDADFTVGGESMEYPGDQSAGPEQVCNCRCQVLPVIERE